MSVQRIAHRRINYLQNKNGRVIARENMLRWDIVYALIVFPCGLLMIMYDRYPARNDSEAHWLRAIQVASGIIFPLRDPSGDGRYGGTITGGSFVSFNNTAVNSPFLYYPTIISQFFMRNSSSHVQYVVASITTLLCSVVCIAVAIHIAGRFANLIAAVAFLPSVFLSLIFPTADAVTNSFSLLFVAVIFKYVAAKKRPGLQSVLILSVLCVLLGQIKTTCFILILLVSLIIWKRWMLDHRFAFEYLIPFILGGTSEFLWLWIIRRIPPWLLSYQEYVQGKKLLFGHPLSFLRSCVMTLIQPLDLSKDRYNVQRNIQLYTGTETTMLPMPVMLLFFLAVVMFVVMANSDIHNEDVKLRSGIVIRIELLLGFTVLLFYVATCAAMALVMGYNQGNMGDAVDGMQSRYFIPMIPVILAMLTLPNWGMQFHNNKVMNRTLLVFLVLGYAGVVASHTFPFRIS